MGIIYGLTAAICWGIGDFLITQVARQIGVIQTLFYGQFLGLLAIVVLVIIQSHTPHSHTSAWALAVGIALINFIGTILLYRAFEIGTLAVVAPIEAGFGVVSALLALLSGERPVAIVLIGALVLIGGVVIVSRTQHGDVLTNYQQTKLRLAGIPESIGVALCFGVSFWAINFVTPSLGVLWPIVMNRGVAFAGALLLLSRRGASPIALPRPTLLFAVGAAVVDTLAFVTFNLGINTTYISVVAALGSLFSAVTVLLAWFFLHERLSPGQWVGVGAILMGVLLVSM